MIDNSKSMQEKLIQGEAERYYKQYDNDPTLKQTVDPCPFFQLFHFADRIDIVLMLVGSLFALGNGISLMFYAEPLGKLVAAFAPNKDTSEIVADALSAMKSFAFNSIIVFLNSWIMSTAWMYTSERQSSRARKAYFESLLRQEMTWHDRNKPEQTSVKMYSHISKVQASLVSNITSTLTKVSIGVAGFILAVSTGWSMTFVMLVFLPVMVVLGMISGHYWHAMQQYTIRARAITDGTATEVFENVKTVKYLDGEDYESRRFMHQLNKICKQVIIYSSKTKYIFAFFMLCILLNYTVGFWYGAYLVTDSVLHPDQRNAYTVSDVIIIFFTLYISNLNLGGLADSIASFSSSRISMTRILDIIERRPRTILGSQVYPEGVLSIQFKNVMFQFEKQLFDGLNLTLTRGMTALIGESGSGKTTLINLICKFYDPFGGQILLHNQSEQIVLRDIETEGLTRKIGYVGQEPVLIGNTIRKVLGADMMADNDIMALLEITQAAHFVQQIGLDSQYKTLSGGQKQRIAIARALIRKPQILILDESTSALDRQNEEAILRALKRNRGINFIIMVAHRMETICDADCILALEHGKIVAKGNYKELVDQGIIKPIEKGNRQVEKNQQQSHEYSQVKQNIKKYKNTDLSPKDGSEKSQPANKFQFKYILRLLEMNHSNMHRYVYAIISSLLLGTVFPFFSYFLSHILLILSGIRYCDPSQLPALQSQVMSMCIWLLCISIGTFFFTALKGLSLLTVNEELGLILKKQSFDRLLHKSMPEIQRRGSFSLSYIVNISCDDLKPLGGYYLGDIAQTLSTMVTGLSIAFIFSWQITLISLAIFPVIILAGKLQMDFSSGLSSKTDQEHRLTHEMVVTAISNIKTVRSLGLEKRILNNYQQALDKSLAMSFKYGNLTGIAFGIGQALISILFSLIFYIGALLVQSGTITVLQLYTSVYAIMFSGIQTGSNIHFVGKLAAAGVAACNYFQAVQPQINSQRLENSDLVLNEEKEGSMQSVHRQNTRKIAGKIEFSHVDFKYQNRSTYLLRDFNLSVEENEKVALVGQSGSGKSTIANLLMRIQDPQSGQIRIGGQRYQDMSVTDLRRSITMVSQQPVLFNRSIFDNIRYNTQATFEEVVQASRLAQAYEFIMAGNFGLAKQNNNKQDFHELNDDQGLTFQQKQFSKSVGRKGSHLSGGQKQRIAIARALIRKPSIIIFDEATSALDGSNQSLIQSTLEELKQTSQIIIAHRLSTVRNCDRIVVMSEGRICEMGHYDVLMKKQGHFYRLANALKKRISLNG